MVRKTSRQAYEELINSGKANTQRAKVLFAVMANPHGLTRRGIASLTGLEINAVCGRVNELLKTGAVIEEREGREVLTGKTVGLIEPAMAKQAQWELF